jgi:hypothetical protein
MLEFFVYIYLFVCAVCVFPALTPSKTARMRARCGRASYVDPTRVTEPDAGAIAVALLLQALVAAE